MEVDISLFDRNPIIDMVVDEGWSMFHCKAVMMIEFFRHSPVLSDPRLHPQYTSRRALNCSCRDGTVPQRT